MSLPKLDIPTFELELPSTGKKVKYRPFLVKEHKLLLMLQDADIEEINRVVSDLVNTCTFEKLKVSEMPSVDIEYLFLNIRARSISEQYEFIINCECGNKIEAAANIDELTIDKNDKHTNKILITETIGFEMKYPDFKHVLTVYEDQKIDNIFDLVLNSVKAVYTPDTYVDIDNSNRTELKEMIDSLTKPQFEKIEEFFTTMPKIVQNIEKQCEACGKQNKAQIRGLENFFA